MPQQNNGKKKFNLSAMSDEEIVNFMNSAETDDECEDFDLSFEDPDYHCDELQPEPNTTINSNFQLLDFDNRFKDPDYQCDELQPEHSTIINSCLQLMDSSSLTKALHFSMNVSNFNLSEIDEPKQTVTLNKDISITLQNEDANPALHELQTKATMSTPQSEVAIKTSFKPKKRARSPLPCVEVSGPPVTPSAGGFTGASLVDIHKNSDEFKQIVWRKKCMQLHVNEVAFRGSTDLPPVVKKLQSPLDFFNYFFTDDLVELISLETHRAAITKNLNTKFKIDKYGIRRYIGVLIFMSVYRYPNIEDYWSEFGFGHIPESMPKNRFEQIKKYLSFNDESKRVKKGDIGYDPIFRIRKVATHLLERFDSIPKNARLSIDEQMCSTKMVHHLRQYLPDKPHKWGVKLFVLCDSNGYSYRFEIYTAAKNDDIVLPFTPNIGATGNVVIRLSQTIPNFVNHILYFDNFYTSLPVMVYLRARGIYALGTVRANRIPKCKLPDDKNEELKKAPRGYSIEFVGSAYGVDITTVLWKDTKNVRLCSTYVGTKPFQRNNTSSQLSKVARYNKKKSSYDEIDCPQIIREYNTHMGGVDLMDSYLGRNGLKIKTQDMATRIFYHFLDMTVTNAFILYRRLNAENNKTVDSDDKIKDMTMKEFRVSIAKELCVSLEKRSVGRPSATQPTNRNYVGRKAAHPVASVRFDEMNHFPEWGSKKSCKFCKKSDTHTFCTKCNIHLCFSKAKNCFKDYHQNE
nr:piggyBac transposable element-derived protein 4-like [Hydra vulgaris]